MYIYVARVDFVELINSVRKCFGTVSVNEVRGSVSKCQQTINSMLLISSVVDYTLEVESLWLCF